MPKLSPDNFLSNKKAPDKIRGLFCFQMQRLSLQTFQHLIGSLSNKRRNLLVLRQLL
jgi:hypothetical protein